ncbi:accessory Sec system protein translocase subunit SecY2 [Staphylococcus chromogenes]|uniref:accessory Sec system protein translocase subunit SecY2 n=1 Tax=Staphylococcus chromogenes TaxID=46126 RepID=UPI000D1C91D7|nr:accessory Sec system protein translocase subunit SecY2 [Staphylococcus chromogenes]PTF58725.1 accessory Sec system protein translocase subunit SecY2 [Staphylococcus chromogenes]
MKNNLFFRILGQYEYKILHKRILFTLFILLIYIFGSHISIVSSDKMNAQENSFYKLAVSNMGGDLHTLNIFSLGLGPWLTAMIFLMLLRYRNFEKAMRQTRKEKHYQEKLLTLALCIVQGYFMIHQSVVKGHIKEANIFLLLLVVVTGAMLLVWMADQNVRYGIAGPMPIVLLSIVRSIFNQRLPELHVQTFILMTIIVLVIVALFVLLLIELIEYRLNYRDIMHITDTRTPSYLAWKLNPAGSISIMISLSVFILLNSVINLIIGFVTGKTTHIAFLSFNNAIGITVYILMQIILGYWMSRLLINTKQKTKDFLKSGNYFVGVYPGTETDAFLNSKARRICWTGSIIVGLIIGIPLYCTLFVPQLSQQIYFAIQLIIMVYISINIAETLRTYLYFDKYQQFLTKYW